MAAQPLLSIKVEEKSKSGYTLPFTVACSVQPTDSGPPLGVAQIAGLDLLEVGRVPDAAPTVVHADGAGALHLHGLQREVA